jgi:outer membrane protein OmpA-like peptidoglycan-associated protein
MNKILATLILIATSSVVFAGNPDRRGEPGAVELNINGYARTAGLWGLNVASVKGLEAERLNPAGLAYVRRTEIIGSYTSLLTGSGVNVVQGGFAQRVKNNAFAVSINALTFGKIDRTTTNSPEGGLGTFSPSFLNIGLSYARNFALGTTKLTGDNVITGGITVRLITQGIQAINATGFSFDAGLQYTTGKKQNFHFGVSLRNIGTPLRFRGDGFAVDGTTEGGYALQVDRKSNKFELPIQLNMGLSYDFYFGNEIELAPNVFTQNFRLTPMFQYTANAYGNDHYGLGMEFSFKEMFMLRAAYRMENGIFKQATRATAYNGLAAGMSVNVPFKKDGSGGAIGIDYGYRMTGLNTNFTGTHTVGLRFNLGDKKDKEKDEKATTAAASSNDEESTTSSKSSKKGKKSAAVELIEKQSVIDSLLKANVALTEKANIPIIKIDTFVQTQVVVKIDTVLVPTKIEATTYKGGKTDTVVENGKTILKFRDAELIQFETGSSVISKKSYDYLNYLTNVMKQNPKLKLYFDGHTDNVGDAKKNLALSQERADAVKTYMVSKDVPANRVFAKGFGDTKPKVSDDTATGKATNRRVEVRMED